MKYPLFCLKMNEFFCLTKKFNYRNVINPANIRINSAITKIS